VADLAAVKTQRLWAGGRQPEGGVDLVEWQRLGGIAGSYSARVNVVAVTVGMVA
jgi:hypothetical protein